MSTPLPALDIEVTTSPGGQPARGMSVTMDYPIASLDRIVNTIMFLGGASLPDAEVFSNLLLNTDADLNILKELSQQYRWNFGFSLHEQPTEYEPAWITRSVTLRRTGLEVEFSYNFYFSARGDMCSIRLTDTRPDCTLAKTLLRTAQGVGLNLQERPRRLLTS